MIDVRVHGKDHLMKTRIVKRADDFAKWYQDVVRCGDLAEPAEVTKGCMVIKPHGYAIWEHIQSDLDRRFKETGHKNAYFPLLIPESFIKKEAEHVEGFAPELAIVTHAGGKKLEEPYVIRPTSETIIGHFFGKWISSWRDLPLLINQWANVMRWELRTRMFLRTSEFLWQEGHTAHASHAEAQEETLRMLGVYRDFAQDMMAMPVICGVKSQGEKFAGALKSYCIEAMMQNGLALQAGTSHDLGQNFGKAFDVTFQNKDNVQEHVWQTSWGSSTRLVGGLIMTHSDDKGLVLPPKLAPIQVVIVPIVKGDTEASPIIEKADAIAADLSALGLRVEVDKREGLSPGAKYFHWEQRGVCVRLELGARDLEGGHVMMKRRIGVGAEAPDKLKVPFGELASRLPAEMESIQSDLFANAIKMRAENTVMCDTMDEVRDCLSSVSAEKGGGKFISIPLKDDVRCEQAVKKCKATIRCFPLKECASLSSDDAAAIQTNATPFSGALATCDPTPCAVTGELVTARAIVSKAY